MRTPNSIEQNNQWVLRQLGLICTVCLSLGLVSCGTSEKITDLLDDTSLLYQPTIIQGDIITQTQLSQLQLGMTRRQVRALIGPPALQDSFHTKRWDYIYTLGAGSRPTDKRSLTLYFADNRLTRMEGGMGATPSQQPTAPKPQVLKVPDWPK